MSSFSQRKVSGIYTINLHNLHAQNPCIPSNEKGKKTRVQTTVPRNMAHYTEIEIFRNDSLIAEELQGVNP